MKNTPRTLGVKEWHLVYNFGRSYFLVVSIFLECWIAWATRPHAHHAAFEHFQGHCKVQ
jgi:hypothetical protein